MIIPEWPANLYREKSSDWEVRARTVLPPESASGLQVPVGTGDPWVWTARLDGIQIGAVLQHRAFAAIRARVQSGTVPVVVRCLDPLLVPWAGGAGAPVTGLPFADGTLHGDGTGHSQPGISVTVEADAAPGAVRLLVRARLAGSSLDGALFSALHPGAHWRLYSVTGVTRAGANFWLDLTGPLWAGLPAGADLDFATPRCTMRVDTQGEGITSRLTDFRSRREASISLVEAHPSLVASWLAA